MHCQDDPDDEGGRPGLLHLSSLLIQRLQGDRRFVRLAVGLDPESAGEHAYDWLTRALHAHGLSEVDTELVEPALLEGPEFDGLVDALVEAMRRPLPLGEDVTAAALTTLGEEMQDDERVTCFLEHVFSALGRPASPSTKAVSDVSREEPPDDSAPFGLLGEDSTLEPQVPSTPDAAPGQELDHDSPLGVGSGEDSINVQSLDQLVLEPDTVYARSCSSC